ncbi:MAG: hypothetical protein HY610_01330 [Elusimicrobia bacterium]|nr:hypothetical protein [Elusimicrobiota bacterium]
MSSLVKKVAILNAAIACAIFASGFAFGEETDYVDVVMSVQSISVRKSTSTNFAVGTATGGTKVVGWVGFTNNSGGAEHFKIRISSVTGNKWTVLEDGNPAVKPGNDQFRLYAIWHFWASNALVNKDEFEANDVLKLTDTTSSTIAFFNDNEPASHFDDPATPANESTGKSVANNNVNGINIPDNSSRDLFLRYDAPATFSAGSSKVTATLAVTAISAE